MSPDNRRPGVGDRRHVVRAGRRVGDRPVTADVRPPMPTVLIVDAHQDGREVLADYLAFHGFDTRQAATADEAVAQAPHCDVAVMELALPRVGGLDVVARLRAAPETASVAVIVYTANVTPMARTLVAAAGIPTFLAKPTDFRLLPSEVLRAFSRISPADGHGRRPIQAA
jgi:CheY-like chemotaxis protein